MRVRRSISVGGRAPSLLRSALCLSLLLALSIAARAEANDAHLISRERIEDRVVELTIETPAFTEPTKVLVDLPKGYDENPSKRWPVTYVTAGTMNNYDSFNKVIHGNELADDYPSIIVSPDGNSGYWSDWYNAGALGPPMYETYVIDQLIPLIDDHFRTIPDRSARAIFGISMGGYGAAMLAAHHPDLFVAAASLSGAVDSNLAANGAVLSISSTFDGGPVDAIYGPRSTQEVRWRGHNPTDLATNLQDVDLQVRTANGVPNPGIGEDPASADTASCVVEGGVHMASVNFHQRLAALHIPHLWKDYGPGCHTPPNFTRETVDTLDAFEQVLADPPAPPRRFDYRSIDPAFSVWDWSVVADPDRALEFMRMKHAGPGGLTLIGSGQTSVTTPPFFKRLRKVDLVSAGEPAVPFRPSSEGRLSFDVDLGAAHPDQQYTDAASAAGAGSPDYFVSRYVKFEPYALLKLSRLSGPSSRPRVCVRSVGPAVGAERVALLDRDGRTVAKSPRIPRGPGSERCAELAPSHGSLEAGRYTLRARAHDSFGHPISAKRRVRVR